MVINLQIIPPQDQVLLETRLLAEALYEYFPEAARLALPYFNDRQIAVDEIMVTTMIRFEVGRLLRANNLPVIDEAQDEDENLSMEHIALLGLAGRFGGYRFKILKSKDGTLPVAGPSELRQSFYGQQLEMALDVEDGDVHSLRPNIIFMWRFDNTWTNVELFLSVPRKGGKDKQSTSDYYTVLVPHPVTTVESTVRHTSETLEEPAITPKETIKATDHQNDLRRTNPAG